MNIDPHKEHILTKEQLEKMGFNNKITSFDIKHLLMYNPLTARGIRITEDEANNLCDNIGKDSFWVLWHELGQRIFTINEHL